MSFSEICSNCGHTNGSHFAAINGKLSCPDPNSNMPPNKPGKFGYFIGSGNALGAPVAACAGANAPTNMLPNIVCSNCGFEYQVHHIENGVWCPNSFGYTAYPIGSMGAWSHPTGCKKSCDDCNSCDRPTPVPGASEPPLNNHTCPHCKNTRCNISENTCWLCGGNLH